ncbi:MAG: hypothetical protein IJS10_00315 [Alphaproteobacteria bacterium]|nr:hypothetical protein [Alphaproteobacteria bacterium]
MKFSKSLLIISIALVGCDKFVENKYTSSKMNDDVVQKMMTPIDDEEEVTEEPEQKQQPVIPENLKQNVSLIINENVSITSVLCETAKKLNISFQMTPKIHSKMIFQARKKPFIEVLDAICDQVNLRYTIENGIVKVVADEPYSEVYDIQFLNLSRDSENKISIETEISTSEKDKKKKTEAGDSNVVVKAKSDFWEELNNALDVMLQSNKENGFRYSVNKQSGIVTVFANSKFQRSVKEYIEKVKASVMSQVLIEAKIIEVTLKNEYRRGIDWGILGSRLSVTGSLGANSANGLGSLASGGVVSFKTSRLNAHNKNDIGAVLMLLEEFGSTRTISNPRITAMNNQAAVLKVAQNHVYFKLNYDKTYASSTSDRMDVSVSSDIQTVPIGLVMFVQPSIDMSNNTITLFLRPTLTRLSTHVSDPAVDIAMKASGSNKSEYEQSKIPVTEVREVASVLKLEDGEIAVLGGFMESRSSKNKTGLPGLRDKPIIGEAVSSHGMGDEIIELVILIKVKLANKKRHQKAADIRLQRFVVDPRPF